MECLKSFSFLSSVVGNVSTGPTLDIYGVSPRISWAYQRGSTGTTFNIQGFKNINIHKIQLVGEFFTSNATGFACDIDDWIFYIQVNGQSPLVGGNITTSPNDFALTYPARNPIFSLSKFNTTLDFADPITSVRSINILDVRASGLSAQSLTTINIGWYMNFMFYYSYEGEN